MKILGKMKVIYILYIIRVVTEWKQTSVINNPLKDRIIDLEFAPHKEKLILAACSSNGNAGIFKLKDYQSFDSWISDVVTVNPCGISCLSWNPCVYQPLMIIFGCYDKSGADPHVSTAIPDKSIQDNLLQIYCFNKKDEKLSQRNRIEGILHTKSINDASWSPLSGRSYHIIATCSKDDKVIIWRLDIKFNAEFEVENYKMSRLNDIACSSTVFLLIYLN